MLKVKNLCKSYESFSLKNVSFSLPSGYIMGFIGKNGAGKTTTIKSILNFVTIDGGEIEILGKDSRQNEQELKKEIGFSLEPISYYEKTKIKKLVGVYKKFFDNFDEKTYSDLIKRFGLDENKKICELSAGMKTKLSLALCLSHGAKLIILDEPTSGLDPVSRSELTDLFKSIVEDGDKSILFSTHITSDLDRCADYILYIHDGKIILNGTKDEIIDSHRVVGGGKEELKNIKDKLIGYKENPFGFMGLMKTEEAKNIGLSVEVPTLEDIMIYYEEELK